MYMHGIKKSSDLCTTPASRMAQNLQTESGNLGSVDLHVRRSYCFHEGSATVMEHDTTYKIIA